MNLEKFKRPEIDNQNALINYEKLKQIEFEKKKI